MTSEVSICNLALGWLGQDPITSLDDRIKSAELCKLNFPALRDAVLESRAWRFATLRTKSYSTKRPGDSTEPGFPEWGSGYVHPIPPAMLQVFRCYRDVSGPEWLEAEWQREGGYIISHSQTLYVWGVKRVTTVTSFSELFTQALAARIAADLAIPLTQNRQLQADYWSLYNDKLVEAAARDGAQGRSESTKANRLTAARAR